MGSTHNKPLLSWLIPEDNALRDNMDIGAYHFRLWKLGEWYDVVVDDFLPASKRYDLFLTRNLTYRNEFWVSLFEKAVAKFVLLHITIIESTVIQYLFRFVGSYYILHGGFLSNATLMISGGIHDFYCTDLSLYVTKKKPIVSIIGRLVWKRIAKMYDEPFMIPNVEELFIILKFASDRNNIIGCSQIDVNFSISRNIFYISISQFCYFKGKYRL